MHQSFEFTSPHGYKLVGEKWTTDKKLKGNVTIAHGMVEHSMRYDNFATFLNEHGYNVYMADHIGHGKNAKDGKGVWPKDGFQQCIDNYAALVKTLETEKVPTFVAGHSMGSFITQGVMEQYKFKNVKKYILIGTSGPQTVHKLAPMFKFLSAFKDGNKPSPFMDKVAFSSYNKKITNPRTSFDWLSVNEENVDKYIADEDCGYICSLNFYLSFFGSIHKLHTKKALDAIAKDIPVLLICGEEDPVGLYGKTVKELTDIYKNLGINAVCEIYPGMRHEILNETNKEIVYDDFLKFIEN